MRLFYLGLILSFSVSACNAQDHDHDHDHHAHSTTVGNKVEISTARVRPPLPGQKTAVAYLDIFSENNDRLLAVNSPDIARIELHTHINQDGIMRMRKLADGIELAGGEITKLETGGLHVMLFDVALADDQEGLVLELDFETAEDVSLVAEIDRAKPQNYGSDSYGSDSYGSDSYGSGHAGSDSHDSESHHAHDSHSADKADHSYGSDTSYGSEK